MELARLYLPVALSFEWPNFVTFTLKVGNSPIKDLDRLIESFRKLRQHKIWQGKKGIYTIELLKKGVDSWYFHIHALIDSKWMDQEKLSEIWLKITGNSFIVDIRRVKGDRKKALKEILKYQTKIWDLNEEDKNFVEEVFRHRRLLNSFGVERPEKFIYKQIICRRPGCDGILKFWPEGDTS